MPNFDPVSVMSASVIYEEKFESLMKNYEAVTTNNEEYKNQNAYLSQQLTESMSPKRRNLISSPSSLGSAQKEQDKRNNPHLVSSSEEDLSED